MTPFAAVDNWTPRWGSFREVLTDETLGRGVEAIYLTELDHEAGSRREWTRAEWRTYVESIAAGLSERGIQSGDSVAALAGNDADALALAFACWTTGLVYLPLNAHEPDDRLGFIVKDAEAALLVYSPAHVERAKRLGETVGVVTDIVPALLSDSRSHWAEGLDMAALQVYTSGTTGEPKGVQLTIRNLLTDCDALQQLTGWDCATRVLVVLPIHHVNGLVVSSLQSWIVGASMVLVDRFRTETFWDDAAAEGATVSSLVPTLLEFLLAHGPTSVPPTFREVFCGAGPLMTETVTSFEDAFGIPVRHLYGLSETTAVATMMPKLPSSDRHAWYCEHGFPSIGPAVPHVEVAVHTTSGNACAEGERGEIVVRGATVMTGYAGRPSATETAFDGGWFHTGDEGFWQPAADGCPYFFVTGRLKELIIRGGVNISPFVVDEVINAHPAVRFGLAVAFENRYYGEEIAAYVVLNTEVTERELLDFFAERLDFAFQPKLVVFGDEVPFTATGKAKRLDLKKRLIDELIPYRDRQFRRSGKTA